MITAALFFSIKTRRQHLCRTTKHGSGRKTAGFFPNVDSSTLSIVIGLLGILSAFLTSLGRYLNYQSKSDMHWSAAATLEEICNTIDFERLPVIHRRRESRSRIYEGATRVQSMDNLRLKIDSHKAKFETMEKSCTDPLPSIVKQAFISLEEIFETLPYRIKWKLYRRYYYALWREFGQKGCGGGGCCCCCFSFLPAFPWYLPNIDVVERFESPLRADIEALIQYDASDAELPRSDSSRSINSLTSSRSYANASSERRNEAGSRDPTRHDKTTEARPKDPANYEHDACDELPSPLSERERTVQTANRRHKPLEPTRGSRHDPRPPPGTEGQRLILERNPQRESGPPYAYGSVDDAIHDSPERIDKFV